MTRDRIQAHSSFGKSANQYIMHVSKSWISKLGQKSYNAGIAANGNIYVTVLIYQCNGQVGRAFTLQSVSFMPEGDFSWQKKC